MHPTNLDLDDSKKAQSRRAGLTRNYGHNLLQSINRPKKEEQSESRASNANNIGNISGGISDTKLKRLLKRDVKGSDKENQSGSSASSVMKYTVSTEDKDVLQLPDDSDDGARFIGNSSDDESLSNIGADMTKTSFRSKNNKSNQTSTSPVFSRKPTQKRTPDSKPSISLKRKNEESDSGHDPEVDLFGNMHSTKKKLKSYIQEHKEPKLPRPGANSLSAKKSYGKLKKTTTYGKKSSPAKGFRNYARGSSPSLISDDGKDKLHDYTTNTPTEIQSPTKGGFVRPDFSDDDLSDLDLPSSSKRLNSEPPSTQFQQLQRYDDDDIMDEAEELAKKLNPDAITGIKALKREDSSDLDDYTGARCPMCNEPVAAEDLEAFGEMNTRKQEKFCLSHQRKSARSDWKSKGYPDIDWATLDSRIASHHAFIKKIIGGASCHSRSLLDATIRAGKDRNLMKSTTNLIPGYYGSRGLRLMSENIMNKFTPKLKKRAPIDRLIAARGPTAFVESVVVPEVTVLLIKEDMKVDDEAAREILKESCEIGDLVNEEIKDVVKLEPRKQINGSSDEEEDFDL